MVYCEIIIGPPGSGKSTYVLRKTDLLKHRNPFTVNLDPGNMHTSSYSYNIYTTTKEYQKISDKGPNCSTKEILEAFVDDFHNFYYDILVDKSEYYLFDLPGQVEFFITGNNLSRMISYLTSKRWSVVVVNLIDLVFFNSSLLSSYLFTYVSVCHLEVPFVCVISKCELYDLYDMQYNLEDIASTKVISFLTPNNKYEEIATELLESNLNHSFQILNYSDLNTVHLLQFVIDRCTGYIYSEDFEEKEDYYKQIS